MVQLTREQRTFITKTFYETESVNVVAIFYQISYSNKEMYKLFDGQNLHISILNGARMRFRPAILI